LPGALDGDHVLGTHVNSDPTGLALIEGVMPADVSGFSPAERQTLERLRQYAAEGRGYLQIQGTRSQTLSYSLTDSPVGQLAWIVVKFKEWTAATAELPDDAVDRDQLRDNVSVYWFTRTGSSAAECTYEEAHGMDWPPPLRSRRAGRSSPPIPCFGACSTPSGRSSTGPSSPRDGQVPPWKPPIS
jgi:epoxide hydrolase